MFYATLIAEAIGTDNPATLSVVEELMRTDRTGLDGLNRVQFIAEARAAFADMQLMSAAGALDEYREALGL